MFSAVVALLLPQLSANAASDPAGKLAALPGELDAIAAGPDSPGATVASGVLVDAAGNPMAGGVAAIAWPSQSASMTIRPGDVVSTPTVGWATVGANGAFSLNVDPSRVSADYMSETGLVNLTLIGWGHGSQGEFSLPTTLPSSAATKAVVADQPQSMTDLKLQATQPLHTRTGRVRSQAAVAAGVTPSVACYETFISSYDAMDVIGETWPYGAHKGSVEIDTGHSVTIGVAVNASGASGGWSANGTSTVSASVSDDYGGLSTVYRDYRMEVRYGKYNRSCGGLIERPLYPTGGFTTKALSGFPTWGNCAPALGTWTRVSSTGNAYSLSGGVKIAGLIGIDLSSSTSYSTTRTLKYSYATSYHVCGDNAVPSLASKVRSGP